MPTFVFLFFCSMMRGLSIVNSFLQVLIIGHMPHGVFSFLPAGGGHNSPDLAQHVPLWPEVASRQGDGGTSWWVGPGWWWGACAPSRARTAAHPRAQAQWRAPANTQDLLVHPRESPAPFAFNPVSLSSGLHPLGDQTNTNNRSNLSFKTISVYNVSECK
jgi:hypothetical protein